MPRVTLPISQGFYVSDALPISNQRCVNFRPNVPQSDTVTADNLFGTPGIKQLFDVDPNDTTRGAHVMAGIPYFVIGGSLYRLNRTEVDNVESFTVDNLGAIEGTNRVYMADNGTQLCIVAPPQGVITIGKSYIFTDTPDALVEITDANFDGPAASVVYVDGFFSFHKSDGKKFFNSPLGDGRGAPSGTAYDALDFSTAEADPDQIRAQVVYRNQLHILGSETTEIFRNIGRAPAPFQRIAGAVIDVGIVAPQSVQLFGGAFAFVGAGVNESPAIWMIQGANKQKLSTTAIDNALSDLSANEQSSIFSWVYAEAGAYFYGVVLPDTCFVYDVVNKRWHERQSIKDIDLTQYRVSAMVTAYGRIIVGDVQSGLIGELDEETYLEYGVLIRRFVTSKPFDDQGRPVVTANIEAVCENGVGLVNDIDIITGNTAAGVPLKAQGGADPQITLSWSDDGGRIFVGDRSRSLGKIGEYRRKQIWRRMGRFPRSRVLRLEIAAPVKSTIIKVEADVA